VPLLFVLATVGGFGVGFRVGTKLHLVALTIVIEAIRRAFIPDVFAFAYFNVWIYTLATAVAITEGTKAKPPPKRRPSIFILAGVFIPFCEACLCSSGFKAMGGHVIFDGAIALGSIADAIVTSTSSSPAAKAAKKAQ
jgi:hypothetical protein